MMAYDVCDDYGVWVVVQELEGRWPDEFEAQEECNRRNFDAGIADKNGDLKVTVEIKDEEQFVKVHYRHPECTCPENFRN